MDITPYVARIRDDLGAVAEGSGPEVADAAGRLARALDPATRLAMMEAISQAAAEITAEMPSGRVEVRLDGRDLGFVFEAPRLEASPDPSSAPPPRDDESIARITLRLPESIKANAEDAAAAAGQSLNTWLVNVVRAAASVEHAVHVDVDLSSLPFLGGPRPVANRG